MDKIGDAQHDRIRREAKMISDYAKKDRRNYRVFRVEEPDDNERKHNPLARPKKVTMVRFHSADDARALAYLKDYVKVANRKYRYYFERWRPHLEVVNGRVMEFESFVEAWDAKSRARPWYSKAWDAVWLFLWRWFVDMPRDVWYWFRDMVYYARHRQHYYASWNLDSYILDTLLHNIPILLKTKMGISPCFLEEATMELHKDEPGFDYRKHIEKQGYSWTKEAESLAVEKEKQTLMSIVDEIRLYQYYSEGGGLYCGWDDKSFDEKYRHTLPIIKGTYDKLDPKKLEALVNLHWNRIWELMKRYGRCLYD